MKVIVNGNNDSYWVQPFTGTGSWTTWSERGIVLPLKAGQNTIELISRTDGGGPNFDTLRLELTDEPIAEIYDPSNDQQQGGSITRNLYCGRFNCTELPCKLCTAAGMGILPRNYLQIM